MTQPNNTKTDEKKKNTATEIERPAWAIDNRTKMIIEQQYKAMEEMKNRVEKYGYLLPEEDLTYLKDKIEESYRKCKIYLDMEKKIEEAGLEPKPKKFEPPKRCTPTVTPKTKPEPKKKQEEIEQLSLLDMMEEPTENEQNNTTKETVNEPSLMDDLTNNEPGTTPETTKSEPILTEEPVKNPETATETTTDEPNIMNEAKTPDTTNTETNIQTDETETTTDHNEGE